MQMNLFTKQKQTHRLREQTYCYQVGRGGWGGIDWESGIDIHTGILKTDNQRGPTV